LYTRHCRVCNLTLNTHLNRRCILQGSAFKNTSQPVSRDWLDPFSYLEVTARDILQSSARLTLEFLPPQSLDSLCRRPSASNCSRMAPDLTAVNRESVLEAYSLIRGRVRRTPVLTSPNLSAQASDLLKAKLLGRESCPRIKLFFKCENLQKTGSFKFRGAMHSLSRMSNEELRKGIVAQSTGRLNFHERNSTSAGC
jgi:hypothetical protein